jgi:putative transposase
MANTYHQVYLQLVFAVKYRQAMLDMAWRGTIQGVIGNLINEKGCKVLIVNGVEDHVHCLIGLKPTVSIADLVRATKAKSSKYINDHNLTKSRFEWQEGYGVFSYSRPDIDNVYRYIESQEEHHKKRTFREEYMTLLEEFGIMYDEQYIFRELQ